MNLIQCDNCGKQVPATRSQFLGDDYSFIYLAVEANEDSDHGQLCSWSCLSSWAAEKAFQRESPTTPTPPEMGA